MLAVLLSGCGLPWPFPQPTPDPKLPDAQQVFRPLNSGPNAGGLETLDPALIQFAFDYSLAQLIFPQLVTLDDHLQPFDWAAASHEISADGLTYTFHLRNGMTWADGVPIDATTFAYSINRALDPCIHYGGAYSLHDLLGAKAFNTSACPPGAVKSTATLIGSTIQTPDPLTLRLQLADPAGAFLSELTSPNSWAVPQALVEQYTHLANTPPYPNDVVSTWMEHLTDHGPFGGNLYLLMSWHPTTASDHGSLIFERNERFWGKKPLLRRIEYTLYKDGLSAGNAFKKGAGDIAYPVGSDLAVASALPGVLLQRTPTLGYWYVPPNWGIAPFDDVRVRQAFSLALDRQALAHEMYVDSSLPTIHLVPEGMPGYNPDLSDAAGRKGKDALTPDLPTARALAHAYAADKCGGDVTTCPPIVLLLSGHISSTNPLRKTIELMISQWQTTVPGWTARVGLMPETELKTFRDLQLAGATTSADYPDPYNLLRLWTTTIGNDYSLVSISQVDALLGQASGMSDQAARMLVYQQAEQVLIAQGAAIPYAQYTQAYAVRQHVVGWRIAPTYLTPLSVWQTAYLKR
jgi:peptide/nickel transport system substrate-binding protein/oligopeptide transport system substrate-binding protein